MPVDPKPFVATYLRQGPLFAPIVRGVECAIAQEASPFEEPVLDLGCGEAVFASIAFQRPLTVGFDPSIASLREATQRHAHQGLCAASATEMPFADGHFRSIVCNSVIEHIPDMDGTLRECHRVLAPNGRLWITTPSHTFGEMLLGSTLLRQLGLSNASTAYTAWFNRHSFHFHTDSLDAWQDRLTRHGFRITRSEYYLTARAHGVFDLLHYLSLPRLVRRKLTGKWVGDWNPLQQFWERQIDHLLKDARPVPIGPYLYIDATRQD